jgi:hypothetical protein
MDDDLVLSVPETLSATYVVPTLLSEDEVRRRAKEAVQTWVPEQLRDTVAQWIEASAVSVTVQPGPPLEPLESLPHEFTGVTPEQLEILAGSAGFAWFSSGYPASVIPVHEWMARGAAAAFAAEIGAPVFDLYASRVLTADAALATLPSEGAVPLRMADWVHICDVTLHDRLWLMTNGLYRFGLPEVRVGNVPPKLRQELVMTLTGLAAKLHATLMGAARESSDPRRGLLEMPAFIQIPAEFYFHRADLDSAYGVPNRGGILTAVGLTFDLASGDVPESFLTLGTPAEWDMTWDDFLANLCHGLFAFEKPTWYYLPELGATLDGIGAARASLPTARDRFVRGELPADAQLMVRYRARDGGAHAWARVTSWEDPDQVTVTSVGWELTPGVRPGPSSVIEASTICDWAIWVDEQGVVEGGATEGRGPGFA